MRRPLMWAACEGHLDIVKYLLLRPRMKVDARADSGDTALTIACRYGHADVVKFLVVKGADVRAKNQERETALTIAESNGHQELAKYLSSLGAKP
jgi:ankyrin repeat protein